MTPEAANILVISDLHLGEDVKPTTKVGYLRHVVMLERELESFLDHYADPAHRQGGRPWRLIINGDMVDFLAVWLLPGEATTRSGRFGDVAKSAMEATKPRVEDTLQLAVRKATPAVLQQQNKAGEQLGLALDLEAMDAAEREEIEDIARFGVGSDADGARAKMIAVGKRHAGVFQRLARFLASGNQAVVIMGNHDVEFHWPEVQESLRDIVAAHGADGAARATIAQNLTFSPWFYYEEDLVWIEHGHQYDDYCSFDYWLNPVAPPSRPHQRPGIVMSLGGAGMRYFSNLMPDMNTYNQEDWTAADYLRWGFRKGVRGVLRVIWLYFFLFFQLARGVRYLAKTAIHEARKVVHLRRLGELARKTQLSEKTLLALDALRGKPVMTNVLKVMQTLMIDRVVIGVVTIVLEIAAFVFLPWPLNGAAAGGLIALAILLGWLSARGRHIDASERLRTMSRMIRKHVSARFVVMGHTHEPVVMPLGDGAMYFNTGTWVATERPGVDRSFTHVLIAHEAGDPRAALCQWSSQTCESRPFDPKPRVAVRPDIDAREVAQLP